MKDEKSPIELYVRKPPRSEAVGILSVHYVPATADDLRAAGFVPTEHLTMAQESRRLIQECADKVGAECDKLTEKLRVVTADLDSCTASLDLIAGTYNRETSSPSALAKQTLDSLRYPDVRPGCKDCGAAIITEAVLCLPCARKSPKPSEREGGKEGDEELDEDDGMAECLFIECHRVAAHCAEHVADQEHAAWKSGWHAGSGGESLSDNPHKSLAETFPSPATPLETPFAATLPDGPASFPAPNVERAGELATECSKAAPHVHDALTMGDRETCGPCNRKPPSEPSTSTAEAEYDPLELAHERIIAIAPDEPGSSEALRDAAGLLCDAIREHATPPSRSGFVTKADLLKALDAAIAASRTMATRECFEAMREALK